MEMIRKNIKLLIESYSDEVVFFIIDFNKIFNNRLNKKILEKHLKNPDSIDENWIKMYNCFFEMDDRRKRQLFFNGGIGAFEIIMN